MTSATWPVYIGQKRQSSRSTISEQTLNWNVSLEYNIKVCGLGCYSFTPINPYTHILEKKETCVFVACIVGWGAGICLIQGANRIMDQVCRRARVVRNKTLHFLLKRPHPLPMSLFLEKVAGAHRVLWFSESFQPGPLKHSQVIATKWNLFR